MSTDVITTVILSLLSALISSFLAAYLTYRYTDLSWRRRRHFEDIKKNCLGELLEEIRRFNEHFMLSEGEISSWVRDPFFQKPASEWCKKFSFGFDEPPATHYTMLLHDLENHFPELDEPLNKMKWPRGKPVHHKARVTTGLLLRFKRSRLVGKKINC